MRTKASSWPLPGVYSPVDLATKILQKHSRLRMPLSELDIFAQLCSLRSEIKVNEVFESFVEAKNLRKLIGYSTAAQLISQDAAEENESQKLSEKSHGALYTLLLLKKISNEASRPVHSFDLLEEATELLEASEVEIDFHVATPITELFLLGFREAYPLELSFLRQLEKRYAITKQSDLCAASAPQLPQGKAPLGERKQILWASEMKMPGPLEATLLSGADTSLRLSVPAHLRFYSPKIEKLKSGWPKNAAELLAHFNTSPVSLQMNELLQRIIEEKTPNAISMLEGLGYFRMLNLEHDATDDTLERKVPLTGNPSHPLLLSLEELPLIDPSQTLLWTRPEKLEELLSDFAIQLNPLKNFRDLEKALLAEGLEIPLMRVEQENFEKIFYSFAPEMKILSEAPSPKWENVPAHSLKSQLIRKALSPSALENLSRCPLQFYYQREERLGQLEIEDDIDVSPLRRGNWIHYTLENLDWQNPKKITSEQIKRSLIAHLSKAFEAKASPAYLKIMQAQTPQMAEALFHYVQQVDVALYESFPGRRSQAEMEVTTPWTSDITLHGRVDRMDFVGDGAFLWDYKTGNHSQKTLAKHMESGKFQWLLYKEIFHRQGTPIHGGGYINPLDLKKSRLFFFESAKLPATFYDRLEMSEVKHERITPKAEAELRDILLNKVSALIEIWKSGVRKANPIDNLECERCSFIGLCGYPYGVTPC